MPPWWLIFHLLEVEKKKGLVIIVRPCDLESGQTLGVSEGEVNRYIKGCWLNPLGKKKHERFKVPPGHRSQKLIGKRLARLVNVEDVVTMDILVESF